MRNSRIYHPDPIQVGQHVTLNERSSHYVANVLRLKPDHPVTLFNGQNTVYPAIITQASKKQVMVMPQERVEQNRESPLNIHLLQSIAKGDKMDFILQKATELGVSEITPIFSDHSEVILKGERLQKRQLHWEGVLIASCEQCGRNKLPTLNPPVPLTKASWQQQVPSIALCPSANGNLKTLDITSGVSVWVGPEGGFSSTEIDYFAKNNILAVQLGPRVLRTETASLAIISVLQAQFGDYL